MSDQGLRRRRTAENTTGSSLSGPRAHVPTTSSPLSGPQAHVAKGPNPKEWTLGFNVLDEPNLRTGTVSDVIGSTLGTTSLGVGTKTHTASGSLASVGNDTTHLRLGSVETSGAATFGTGPRLLTVKANASLVDARVGTKENYARVQGGGIEFNGKLDKDKQSPHSAFPVLGATVRSYTVAAEVGGGYKKKLPMLGPDYHLTVAGKVRASVGQDLFNTGKSKSDVRIPMGPGTDLKVKVSGGINIARKKEKTD